MTFKLKESFVDGYKGRKPPFGFNGLGEVVFYRTYSREKEDGTKEAWWEVVRRVVEGTFSIQKRHIEAMRLPWDNRKAQRSAQDMYDRIWNMKFSPPGRGFWAMGTDIVEKKGLAAALNNCAFVSTKDLDSDPISPFTFLMDASMLGVGVGFDTKGAGKVTITDPSGEFPYKIPDTREGWVESVSLLLSAFFHGTPVPIFDYSGIRPEGAPIKTFGGTASGPAPLKKAHERIVALLQGRNGDSITVRDIVDIQNILGVCVVSGNVRRSSEIALGPATDEYLDLKNWDVSADRGEWAWASNNSILADLGMDYLDVARRTVANGEPGFIWMDNVQAFSRMGDDPDWKDERAEGTNPCGEQSLESHELCCLCETYPNRHEDLEDYLATLKQAYLYAKTVTLLATHWPETNRILLRNRRIGTSMTGVAQFIADRGVHELIQWAKAGYNLIQERDKVYSEWLAVPRSIKTTSIKPSGSVSLLAGATPGMHYPISPYYIRRVRIGSNSPLLDILRDAGYHVEEAVNEDATHVVEFPVYAGEGVRSVSDVSMWEQLSLAALLQEHWADNQVSCTVTIPKDTDPKELANALDYYQYKLKSVSFLPDAEGVYEQMPYERITKQQYDAIVANLRPLDFSGITGIETEVERFCDGDVCLT